jgi:DNA-binding NarL/FixJ family response regulator
MAVRSGRRLLRDALVAWFGDDPRLSVVGAVATTGDLLTLCGLCLPDVIVYDLGSDIDEELAVLRTLRLRHPASRLIVIYDHTSFHDLTAVWETGPHAVMPDSYGLEALAVTMPQSVDAIAEPVGHANQGQVLTELERDIITMVGVGHTASRIATLLDMSANAVENAKRRIYQKLGVTCQSQAVARIADLGLADWSVHPDRGSRARPIAVLYGPPDAARRVVVTTLLRHRIAFVIGTPSDGTGDGLAHRPGDVERDQHTQAVNVLIGADNEWPAATGEPTILVHEDGLSRAHALKAVSHGIQATVPLDCVGYELVPLLMFAFRGCQAFHTSEDPAASAERPHLVKTVSVPLLTSREKDILRSIAVGHTVRQTARSLGIAVKTVENIQARLLRKLDAKNRASALASAYELGLIEPLRDHSFAGVLGDVAE